MTARFSLLATLLAALLAPLSSQAEPLDADTLATQLGHWPITRGTFIQRHTLRFLTHPLVSTGHFLYARDHGLHWVVDQPVRAGITVTAAGAVCATDTDLARGAGAIVARLVGAMLAGDLAALGDYFTPHTSGDRADWQVRLEPRAGGLAKAIAGITLHGAGGELKQVDVAERGGGETRIELHEVTHPATLSNDQRAQLRCRAPQP